MLRPLTVTPDQSFVFSDRATWGFPCYATTFHAAVGCDCAAPWSDDATPRTDRPLTMAYYPHGGGFAVEVSRGYLPA